MTKTAELQRTPLYDSHVALGGNMVDLIVTRRGGLMRLVINAGNREKDLDWIRSQTKNFEVDVKDVSDKTALIALQGPKAVDVMAALTNFPVRELGRFRTMGASVAGAPTNISRTGYTGEDGFELWLHNAADAAATWQRILKAGEKFGILACGLAARDSLRLEAGLALYGHEIAETINPYEAGLGWVTKLGKAHFIGQEALRAIEGTPLKRKLTGLKAVKTAKKVPNPQAGNSILFANQELGQVASGAYSPMFDLGIATAHLPPEIATLEGAEVDIEVRGKLVAAQITRLPFYKRPK